MLIKQKNILSLKPNKYSNKYKFSSTVALLMSHCSLIFLLFRTLNKSNGSPHEPLKK